MAKRLTQEAIEQVRSDSSLFIQIANTLKVKPTTLSMTLSENRRRLTEYDVVKLIAETMGVNADDILEETNVTA